MSLLLVRTRPNRFPIGQYPAQWQSSSAFWHPDQRTTCSRRICWPISPPCRVCRRAVKGPHRPSRERPRYRRAHDAGPSPAVDSCVSEALWRTVNWRTTSVWSRTHWRVLSAHSRRRTCSWPNSPFRGFFAAQRWLSRIRATASIWASRERFVISSTFRLSCWHPAIPRPPHVAPFPCRRRVSMLVCFDNRVFHSHRGS